MREQSDIWSLGTVLYEMLTGRAPFAGDSATEIIQAILTVEPPPLPCNDTGIPPELQEIVTRMLRKGPNERYFSARELMDALKAVQHQMEVAADSRGLTDEARGGLLVSHTRRARSGYRAHRRDARLRLTFWDGKRATAAPEKSIAVLPFENLSEGKEDSPLRGGDSRRHPDGPGEDTRFESHQPHERDAL